MLKDLYSEVVSGMKDPYPMEAEGATKDPYLKANESVQSLATDSASGQFRVRRVVLALFPGAKSVREEEQMAKLYLAEWAMEVLRFHGLDLRESTGKVVNLSLTSQGDRLETRASWTDSMKVTQVTKELLIRLPGVPVTVPERPVIWNLTKRMTNLNPPE